MHPVDWAIVGIYITWIAWSGIRLTKRTHEIEGYFLGGRSLPWWAVGLSVMATQLSAITMHSAPTPAQKTVRARRHKASVNPVVLVTPNNFAMSILPPS